MEMADASLMINYFLNADHEFLKGMGVEPSKLFPIDEWQALLAEDFARPIPNRHFYYLLWEFDGQPIGHSNINKITFGEQAHMHLHLWDTSKRQKGNGQYYIHECIDQYFKKFQLQKLFCEPYAKNPAPNKTLPKVGFTFVKDYTTIPGWICFSQTVSQWVLTKEKWTSTNKHETFDKNTTLQSMQ